ncbi:hypothetical protein AB0945_33215 [Streptomyces sp. NPDC005474]|uniref:hypothetical protein n=1 Tax=Streptomyces sp. NPDC005474 TaxID=3154878 RepID=UPI003453AF5F
MTHTVEPVVIAGSVSVGGQPVPVDVELLWERLQLAEERMRHAVAVRRAAPVRRSRSRGGDRQS